MRISKCLFNWRLVRMCTMCKKDTSIDLLKDLLIPLKSNAIVRRILKGKHSTFQSQGI